MDVDDDYDVEEFVEEEHAITLNIQNFDEVIAEHEFVLVNFNWPQDPQSRALEPQFQEAAKILKDLEKQIPLAQVNVIENEALAMKFTITRFPTLIWFTNGKRKTYTGAKNTEQIVKWVKKRAFPLVKKMNCVDLMYETPKHKYALIYFGESTDYEYRKILLPYAEEMDKFEFFYNNEEHCAEENTVKAPGFAFYRRLQNHMTKYHPYQGAMTLEAVQAWILPLMVPSSFEFKEEHIQSVFTQKLPILFLFRSKKDQNASFMATFVNASIAHEEKIKFGYSDIEVGIQSTIANLLLVKAEDLPTYRIVRPGKHMRKYASEFSPYNMTIKKIGHFIDEVLAGNVQQLLKSEPIPQDEGDGPVKVIVGANFKQTVRNKNKNFLVFFHRPWCQECEQLKPGWTKLAQFYKNKNMDDYVIATFDSLKNEAPGVVLDSFPKIILYSKTYKKGVIYTGEFRAKDIKIWMEKYTVSKKKDEL